MQRPQYYRPRQFNNNQHASNFRPRGRFPCNPQQLPTWARHPRPPMQLQIQPHASEEHWCETCDRAFPTVPKLEEHKQQHQKCNIDGCQFTAHPNMVTKHIQMQHATGLFKKIGNLNKPEEINKWREERKKKYPTKQNVDKKAAEVKEKIERGEKMGLQQDRFAHTHNEPNGQTGKQGWKRNHQFGRDNQTGKNNPPKKVRKKFPFKKPETDLSISENRGTLKPFAGIQQIIVESDNVSEDDRFNDLIEDDVADDIPLESAILTNEDKNICSAISTLISNYGSSDEEIDKIPKKHNNVEVRAASVEIENKTLGAKKLDDITKNIKKNYEDDDSGPEEVKVVKESINDNPEPAGSTESEKKTVNTNKKLRHNKSDNKNRKPFLNTQRRHKVPSTLIYKLLHKEIRQERNIVLQCVRHIVKNNYFDKSKE